MIAIQLPAKFRPLFSLVLLLTFVSCTAPRKIAGKAPLPTLHFIGEHDIPFNLQFEQTTIGGLSGIDYNPSDSTYYIVCDDRSAINAARFYKARIFITPHGIDSLRLVEVRNMLRPDGSVYPNNKQDPLHVPDPEAMRYNGLTNQLTWSSEGERVVNSKDTLLENPAITNITTNGNFIDSFPLPAQLAMASMEKGPRQNSVLEGLSYADHFKTLYASVEEPLYEDGPRADTIESNAFIRILQFDAATKKNTRQFAYKLDPVAHGAIPSSAYKINGIPDILAADNDQLFVIERSFSTGRPACTIKVFAADLRTGTDISEIASLRNTAAFTPLTKKLLLNMDDLGIYIDNIEGMTWGPTLPNGNRTLLFIADNNFSPLEKSQVMLFEVTGNK